MPAWSAESPVFWRCRCAIRHTVDRFPHSGMGRSSRTHHARRADAPTLAGSLTPGSFLCNTQKSKLCASEKRIPMRAMIATSRPRTRGAILDAVDQLLGVLGYRKLTVDDVAQAAGISRRTFYLHFTGKEEATLACLDRNIE